VRIAGSVILLAFFGVILVWPMVVVLTRSLGSPVWSSYAAQLATPATTAILMRTLATAVAVTAITLLIGYPAAYAITRMSRRRRITAIALLLLPYLTSLLVRTYVWMAILGHDGPVVWLLRQMGVERESLIGTWIGVLIVLVHVYLPLMVLVLYVSMRAIDVRQMDVAASSGASRGEAFVRVFLPQTTLGTAAGCALVFLGAAGAFVTPALIGGPSQFTIVMLIFDQLGVFEWRAAATLAIVLFAGTALILAIGGWCVGFWRSPKRKSKRGPARQSNSIAPIRTLGRVASWVPRGVLFLVTRAALAVAIALVDVPLLLLLAVSLQPLPILALPTHGLSLHWYARVISNSEWLAAGTRSIELGFVSAAIALSIGYIAAWRAHVGGSLERWIVTSAAFAPLAIPVIVFATGLYAVYVSLGLIGQFVAIAAAHALLGLPFVFVYVAVGLASYDERLSLVAASLGATAFQSFWRVRWPLLRPAFAIAFGVALLVSFEEFVVTNFLAGTGFQTLPLRMWAGTQQDLSPELAVVGSMIVAGLVVLSALAAILRPRRGQPA